MELCGNEWIKVSDSFDEFVDLAGLATVTPRFREPSDAPKSRWAANLNDSFLRRHGDRQCSAGLMLARSIIALSYEADRKRGINYLIGSHRFVAP